MQEIFLNPSFSNQYTDTQSLSGKVLFSSWYKLSLLLSNIDWEQNVDVYYRKEISESYKDWVIQQLGLAQCR